MNLQNIEKAHLIGIGGITVSAIAQLLASKGITVSGSDMAISSITDMAARAGVSIYEGHDPSNVPRDADVVIFSEAVPASNVERGAAAERGIQEMSAFSFWGAYAQDKKVIAVSGTNGKSTTTAMLGRILTSAGYDPTVVVGTKVLGWDSNIRIGSSDWLVIEADEYHGHMHEFKPHIAVVTNVALDHLDYYRDGADISDQFERWLKTVDKDGCIVLNRDDHMLKEMRIQHGCIKYFGLKGTEGIRSSGEISLYEKRGMQGENGFNIVDDEHDWGYVSLKFPGAHNRENALAAAAAADCAGVKHQKITKALTSFEGTWRRFEYVGLYHDAFIISDYAHHPDAIRSTIEAARSWYGDSMHIVAVFEPHQHNRTKMLFKDFAKAFDGADELILSEIYDVAGREESHDQDVTSEKLAHAIRERCVEKETTLQPDRVFYVKNLNNAEQAVKHRAKKGVTFLIMGAGNIDRIARNVVQ